MPVSNGAPGLPLVTIIMPALDEAAHIEMAIRSILPPVGKIPCELIVVDGGSSDETCAIVRALIERDPRIRLIHNERRIQSAGVNLAARVAHPDATHLVRADCHALYPDGWVEGLVDTIIRRDAVSVVVPLRTIGTKPWQRAIAAAQNCRFGNGGSAHRIGGISGYVSHGHHAAFERRAFLRVGGYDETFSHNEDAEFDRRLCAAAGKIYLADDLAIGYFPRATLPALARQYFRYGRGCARTLHKHRALPALRQGIPPLMLVGCVLALFSSAIEPCSLLIPASYVGLCLSAGLVQSVRLCEPVLAMSGIAAVTMHLSWGAGFLSQWRFVGTILSSRFEEHGRQHRPAASDKTRIVMPSMPITIREEV